jgi:hypothetical protein
MQMALLICHHWEEIISRDSEHIKFVRFNQEQVFVALQDKIHCVFQYYKAMNTVQQRR